VTFTSAEVGNGNANDANQNPNDPTSPQDGGLAVRVQAEDPTGATTGDVSRFDDEGITFSTKGDATFDVRDLVSGVSRGDYFDEVTLGTSGADVFDETGSTEEYYINGGGGDDTLTGGVNRDFLVGGAGNDTLNGKEGNDTFIGGGGSDMFVFTGLVGNDQINDFMSGTDKIDFSSYDITAANVSTMTSGANTIVLVDSNRDGATDFQITLLNSAAPNPMDYLF
jgi:Ca2+-binding RTX toxin-like protein